MLGCFLFSLEDVASIVSIATPFILLTWFFYSRKEAFSSIYYSELKGIYAGYTDPVVTEKGTYGLDCGIIMNIRSSDENGFFKGELDYAETIHDRNLKFINKVDGIYTFLGKLNYKIYGDKNRHPYKPSENRIYKGILYIVDRLDFNFENFDIETYTRAEYSITHYREMQVLKFKLKKVYNKELAKLPESFTLNKSAGFDFEPYVNLKKTVFINGTRADK
jgi:hypothetical protein